MDQTAAIEGTIISHYRVRARIGVGGMGEVYLAEDTKLERLVALKILPAQFAADTERMRRFIQEAKTASALNHPNIITIYEIGQEEAVLYIATEHIEGENLRAHLNRAQLTLLEVLDIAIQCASALAAAHEAGVVHRDIKPENLMLRRDGILKVLDFGLAKLTDSWEEQVDREARTITKVETVPGTVLGTTVYMSPEQARGKEVDERTDIWSLGVLLYEMITQRLPFAAETTSDVIASILKTEPPAVSYFVPTVPFEFERIVEKAMQKDREERYQGVKDLLVDLRRLKKQLEFETGLGSLSSHRASAAGLHSGGSKPSQGRTGDRSGNRTTAIEVAHATSSAEYIVSNIKRHKSYALLALALIVALLIGAGYALSKLISPATTPSGPQSLQVTRFTAMGKAAHAAISPDGKYVAYVVIDGGDESVWLGQVAAGSQTQIVSPAGVNYRGLSFTPDGEFLFFVASDKKNPSGGLYQIPALGGAPRRILANIQSPIALSPDGKQFAFIRYHSAQQDALMIANVDGSGERELAKHSSPDFYSKMAPSWSPDGRVVAVVYQNTSGGYYENVVAVSVSDGTETPITSQRWWQVGQVAWLPGSDGLIAAATDDAGSLPQLWYLPYQGGPARRITSDLNGYTDVGITADSHTLVSVRSDRLVNIWRVPGDDPGAARQITSGSGRDDGVRGLSWTPDGRIVYRSVAGGEPNVWLMEADGSQQRQLSINMSQNFDPEVSPDGRYIVWGSRRTGNTNLWRMDLDGGNPKQITDGVGEYFPTFSPDGKWILYTAYDPASGFWRIWKIGADGGAAVKLTDRESALSSISPDGRLFACNYQDSADGSYGIAVIPIEGGQPLKVFDIPGSFGRTIHWTRAGDALTYTDTRRGVSNLWLQKLSGGEPRQLTDFRDQRIFSFAWSSDGKQLAISRGVVNSDVVLLKGLQP